MDSGSRPMDLLVISIFYRHDSQKFLLVKNDGLCISLSFFLSVCLSVSVSQFNLLFYLFIYLLIYLFIYFVLFYLFIYLNTYLFIYLFTYIFIYFLIYLLPYLFILNLRKHACVSMRCQWLVTSLGPGHERAYHVPFLLHVSYNT